MHVRHLIATALSIAACLPATARAEQPWLEKLADIPMNQTANGSELIWSPNAGQALLFRGSSSHWLIDVREHKVTTVEIPVVPIGAGAWSPDGQLIAMVAGGVHLVSFPTLGHIQYRPLKRAMLTPGCWAARGAVASFTPDGRFLWVSCGAQDEREGFTVAVKLSVPDLEVVDRIEVAVPDIGARTTSQGGVFSIDERTRAMSHHVNLLVVDPEADRQGRYPLSPDSFRHYLMTVNLPTKQRTAISLDIDTGVSTYLAGHLLATPDGDVAFLNAPLARPHRRVDLYLRRRNDAQRIERLNILPLIAKLLPDDSAGPAISSVSLLPDQRLLMTIGSVRDNNPSTAVEIALKDLSILRTQEITKNVALSVSPDQSHMISIVDRFHRLSTVDQTVGFWMQGGPGPHSGVEIFSLH